MLQENICLTLLPKNAHGITQRPTLLSRGNHYKYMNTNNLLARWDELSAPGAVDRTKIF